MGWLQFVASLADSLAWPLSVVALAVVFRPMISQLDLTGVRRWKAGPAGIEIENWDREARGRRHLRLADLRAEAELGHTRSSLSSALVVPVSCGPPSSSWTLSSGFDAEGSTLAVVPAPILDCRL